VKTLAPQREYISAAEAADIFGFSEQQLSRRRRIGNGPPFVKNGHTIMYSIEKFRSWLESLTVTNTAEGLSADRSVNNDSR
jgi:hypothetical protein